jgi:hypothetical protein
VLILLHLYHHHYQQSSFLITCNTTNLTCKSNLAATLGSLFSEGLQIVSTQVCDNCLGIFNHLEFFSLFGLALGHLSF